LAIEQTKKIIAFDYLRTFVIILVVLYHSIVSYTPLSRLSQVTDNHQWLGFQFIVLFNDAFIMFLLFLISGLFIWESLQRKGTRKFLRDRFIRLGLPYIIVSAITAYWGVIELTGHLWFLWILLVFDVFAAILYKFIPHLDDKLKTKASFIFKSPLVFLGILLAVPIFIYLPMISNFTPQWIVLLYFIYFLAGLAIGAYGIGNTIFTQASKLTKYWWLWLITGIIVFVIRYNLDNYINSSGIIYNLSNIIFCALMTMGVIATFLRFIKQRLTIMDNLNNNAYGIYIIHYIFVTGLQYYLLNFNIHAIYKALIVFIISFMLSWLLIIFIRRFSLISKVI